MDSRARVFALCGLVALLALLGGILVMHGGGASNSSAAPVIRPLHPVKKRTARPAPKRVAATRGATVAKPAVKRHAAQPAVVDGLPRALSDALAVHSVVVVSLVAPDSAVDELAKREAQAGASDAGAGFVAISVENEKAIEALTVAVNSSQAPTDRLLDDPAVLVFQRGGKLFVRLNGFADAQTVEQAAVNASPDPRAAANPPAARGAVTWVAGANDACTKLRAQVASTPFPTSPNQIVPYAEALVRAVQTAVTRLHALKPPAGKAARVAAMLRDYDAMLADVRAMLAAAQRGDRATAQSLDEKVSAEGSDGDRIALELGATACAQRGH